MTPAVTLPSTAPNRSIATERTCSAWAFESVRKPGSTPGQQCLKRVDPADIAGHRYDGDDAAAERRRHGVRSIVADDHCRAPRTGPAAAGRVQVDEPDLTALRRASTGRVTSACPEPEGSIRLNSAPTARKSVLEAI